MGPVPGARLQAAPPPAPGTPAQVPSSSGGNLPELLQGLQSDHGPQAEANGGLPPAGMPPPPPPPPSPQEKVQAAMPGLDSQSLDRYAMMLENFEQQAGVPIADPQQVAKFIQAIQKREAKYIDQMIKSISQEDQGAQPGAPAAPQAPAPAEMAKQAEMGAAGKWGLAGAALGALGLGAYAHHKNKPRPELGGKSKAQHESMERLKSQVQALKQMGKDSGLSKKTLAKFEQKLMEEHAEAHLHDVDRQGKWVADALAGALAGGLIGVHSGAARDGYDYGKGRTGERLNKRSRT